MVKLDSGKRLKAGSNQLIVRDTQEPSRNYRFFDHDGELISNELLSAGQFVSLLAYQRFRDSRTDELKGSLRDMAPHLTHARLGGSQ